MAPSAGIDGHGRRHHASAGFTLLELLVSLTIIAVTVVLIMGAFRIGVRAWEKGERDVETHQRTRAVLDIVSRQIGSIRLKQMTNAADETFYLNGTHKSLEFLSVGSLPQRGGSGIVHLKYMVEKTSDAGESLTYSAGPFTPSDPDMGSDELDSPEVVLLIPEAHLIGFEYLESVTPEDGFKWRQSWEPIDIKGVPLAVRLTLQENAGTPPVKVIARIVPAIEK